MKVFKLFLTKKKEINLVHDTSLCTNIYNINFINYIDLITNMCCFASQYMALFGKKKCAAFIERDFKFICLTKNVISIKINYFKINIILINFSVIFLFNIIYYRE